MIAGVQPDHCLLTLRLCSIGITISVFLYACVCSTGEKPFSIGLVDQLFQPASNQFETVNKLLEY